MIGKLKKSPTFLLFPMLFSFLGLIYCMWRAYGGNSGICFSAGCTLFQDMTINGISMWWGGVVAFALFFILAVLGNLALAKLVTAIALFIDLLLLVIMINIAPCTSCLIVAFFFACTYISFRTIYVRNNAKSYRSVLFVTWAILFAVNALIVIKPTENNWIMYGNEKANIKMYFAPSCQSCKEGVIALANNNDVAFYPVNNDGSDVFMVSLMSEQIKLGKNIKEALNMALLVKEEDYKIDYFSYNNIVLYLRLLKNKAHVIGASGGTIPYFEIAGLPKALITKVDENKNKAIFNNNPTNSKVDYSLPIDLEIAGNCGEKDKPPCP